MRRTAIALALVSSAVLISSQALAGDKNMTFKYYTTETCIQAPGFGPDFDPQNFALLLSQQYSGTIIFDVRNHKAFETMAGTVMWNPFASLPDPQPGGPSGSHAVVFFDGQCTYAFDLSNDGSFSLQTPPEGCKSGGLNDPYRQQNYNLDWKSTGQFAADMQSFMSGKTDMSAPIISTLRTPGGDLKRICTRVSQGVRIDKGTQNNQ